MDAIQIALSNGGAVIVDAADAPLVMQTKWWRDSEGYACGKPMVNGVRRQVRMHRLILGFPQHGIDHRDRNRLNNCRGNLRPCNTLQNSGNQSGWSSTGFKGVRLQKRSGRYEAQIGMNGINKHLGTFATAAEAASAYDAAASNHFGEFASPNFSS